MTAQDPSNVEGLEVQDLSPGQGDTANGPGQTLIVHYTGWLEDGTVFDSSRQRNRPFSFPLGCGLVIKGWDLGLVGMKVGGLRRLRIGPELAYGSNGAGALVPPDATLTFEVELLEISE